MVLWPLMHLFVDLVLYRPLFIFILALECSPQVLGNCSYDRKLAQG